MAENDISSSPFLRAAAKVQARRAVDRTNAVKGNEPAPIIQPTTSAQIRAKLNVIPDETTLNSLIDKALTALSRGVRWARGSILNLLV